MPNLGVSGRPVSIFLGHEPCRPRQLALLALLVSACGGGSSTPSAAPEPEPASATPAPEGPRDAPVPAAPDVDEHAATADEPDVTADALPAPPPLATADVALDGEGTPAVVPALRGVDRLGEGPWVDSLDIAIGAGWVDFAADEEVGIHNELEHRRARFVLALAPPRRVPAGEPAGALHSLWLAKVESRASEGGEEHRRLAALLLYDYGAQSEPLDPGQGGPSPFTCGVEEQLRARDIDGDGEVEVTVIAAFLRPTREEWAGGGSPDECGAIAFIVGADDWNVQAAFTREYAVQAFAASIEVAERRETLWQLRDLDGDGRADLRVVERWRFLDDFMGDYIGDGESMPPSRTARSERREVDCPYVPEADAWRCPDPAPGRLLFEDPSTRGAARGVRPW